MRKFLIIGANAAGLSAASKIKRIDKDAEVTVLEKSGFISYGSCGLPYFVAGIAKRVEDLYHFTPESIKEKRGIDVLIHTEAQRIDKEKRIVYAIKDGKEVEFEYDKLLVSTGASPIKIPFPGVDLFGIFQMRLVEDGIAMKNYIEENRPKRAVIVGGGYIGLEFAETFGHLGIDVTIVEKLPTILSTFDPEIVELVKETLKNHNVKIYEDETVMKFEGKGKVEKVITDKREIEADLVLLSIGVRPNTGLLKDIGVELGEKGAILVNKKMETNLPHIYAAGDCATVYHMVWEKDKFYPLGPGANKGGRVAGSNMAGVPDEFQGIVGTAIFKAFDMEVAKTGLIEREARELLGDEPKVSVIDAKSKPGYYPGGKKIRIKIISDREGRFLGAQIAGGDVHSRINFFATALVNKMNVKDMRYLDLPYAPPFAPVWDPALIACETNYKKLERR